MAIIYRKDDKIKDYIIDSVLEDGEYATSYIALDETGKKVFLKVYKSPTAVLKDEFEPFIAQQQYLKDLLNSLPLAETILELFEIDDMFHCQVKEFLEGADLADYLSDNVLDMDARRFIASMIVYALIDIHKSGIIHADLKKEQIFVKEDKDLKNGLSIKIIDFDFSRIPDKYDPVYKITTLFYSSPEYLRDETPEYASDVFTLGIILYELLCREYPYDVDGPEAYHEKVLKHQIRSAPHEIEPAVDEYLSDLIIQMLSPRKEERPSLQEVHECLTGVRKRRITNKIVRLSQEGTSYTFDVTESMIVGRVQLVGFAGCEYASGEQLVFSKTPVGWKVKMLPNSVNPVYLGAKKLSEAEERLGEESKIYIGSIRHKKGMEIDVSLIDE